MSHVSPCYSYRDQSANESDESYVSRLAQELEEEFQRQGPDQVCAFIAETVAGTVGNLSLVYCAIYFGLTDTYRQLEACQR